MRQFQAPPLSEGAKKEFEKSKLWLEQTTGPLYVEVGCGVGFHPLAHVREHPESRILAFERTREKYDKASRRLVAHQAKEKAYQKCLIVHADASHLWDLFPPQSLAGLYFLYPNPYPKTSQANLRLAAMPFFRVALESLKIEGTFQFATNEKFYFEELRSIIAAMPFMKTEAAGPIRKDIRPRSHFEKKYLERGEACYEILARRIISAI